MTTRRGALCAALLCTALLTTTGASAGATTVADTPTEPTLRTESHAAGTAADGPTAAARLAPEGGVAAQGTAPQGLAAATTGDAAVLLRLINGERAARSRPAVSADAAVTDLAQRIAADMARRGSLTSDIEVEDELAGFWFEAEALHVRHPAAPPEQVLAWVMGEAGGVLLAPDWTHAGIGRAATGGDVYYTFLMAEYRFRDVGPSVAFHTEIDDLAAADVIGGYADGTYRPSRAISRQAVAAFLHRMVDGGWLPGEAGTGGPCAPTVPAPFPDVPRGHPFCGDIGWLAGSGVTGGYGDGTFRPSRNVSRQAMSAFLFRALDPGAPDPTCAAGEPRTFSDVPASHPFCGTIEWLATTGITTGYPDGSFRPGQPVTRQAMAAFLWRSVAAE